MNETNKGLIVYAWLENEHKWVDISNEIAMITRRYDVSARYNPITYREVNVPHRDSEIEMLFSQGEKALQPPVIKVFVVFWPERAEWWPVTSMAWKSGDERVTYLSEHVEEWTPCFSGESRHRGAR